MKKYPKYFTVGDLKVLLKDIPDKLPIGLFGYFGEFHHMDKYDFHIGEAYSVPKNQINVWGGHDPNKIRIFQLEPPDIGPYPD